MIHAKDYSATAVIEQLRCEMCFAVVCFLCVDRVSHATRLYYHVHVLLSTTFLKSFFTFSPPIFTNQSVEFYNTITIPFYQDVF